MGGGQAAPAGPRAGAANGSLRALPMGCGAAAAAPAAAGAGRASPLLGGSAAMRQPAGGGGAGGSGVARRRHHWSCMYEAGTGGAPGSCATTGWPDCRWHGAGEDRGHG